MKKEEKPAILSRGKWVITPGLIPTVEKAELIYKTHFPRKEGKMLPILIHGARGVGKTVFADIFFKLFQESNPDVKVERKNLAAVPEDLLDSAFFGHEKGAFTGAINSQPGWFEQFKNSILIFDEIGEIPDYVQAKLLSVIEYGKFQRIGASKNQDIQNLQIIATTNRDLSPKGGIREDFLDRFLIFEVPPLCGRREDILPYLAWAHSQTIHSLTRYQVLTLVCHNWEGNFRELERFAEFFEVNKKLHSENQKRRASVLADPEYEIFLKNVSAFESSRIDGMRALNLYRDLKQSGVDVDFLEKILNRLGLGLSPYSSDQAFPGFPDEKEYWVDYDQEFKKRFEIDCLKYTEAFSKAFSAFALRFCQLFYQNHFEDKNLLEVKKGELTIPITSAFRDPSKREARLEKGIFEFLSGTKISWPIEGIPNPNTGEYHKFMLRLQEAEGSKNDQKSVGLTSFTEEALLKKYWTGLHSETGGNKSEMQRRAGLKSLSTVDPRLKKYKIGL